MNRVLFSLPTILCLVLCDKWNYMKEEEKWKYNKKKDYINSEDQKKEMTKLDSKKVSRMESTTEVFMKDERQQLCQSVDEDDVKNALLKFGVVLHLVDDVAMFKKNMKSFGSSMPSKDKTTTTPAPANTDKPKMKTKTDKLMIKQKGGSRVKVEQGNWVGRAFPVLNPMKMFYDDFNNDINFGNNFLNRKRRSPTKNKKSSRGRKGTTKVPLGQVPQCYGWKYLSVLDAMLDEKTVDVDVLLQSMSDMLDMKFTSAVSSIFQECGDILAVSNPMCPIMEVDAYNEGSCDDQCNPQHVGDLSDCPSGQYCCKSSCGGYRCLKSHFTKKPEKCQVADQYMQCVYQKIDTQICS